MSISSGSGVSKNTQLVADIFATLGSNRKNEPLLESRLFPGFGGTIETVAFYALSGYCFDIISPVGGAVFGATAVLCAYLGIEAITEYSARVAPIRILSEGRLFMSDKDLGSAFWCISVAGFFVGYAVTNIVGFPLSIAGAGVLYTTLFVANAVKAAVCSQFKSSS